MEFFFVYDANPVLSLFIYFNFITDIDEVCEPPPLIPLEKKIENQRRYFEDHEVESVQ